MKRIFTVILVFFVFAFSIYFPKQIRANSCVIQFSTATGEIKVNSEFTVVCQVTSQTAFSDVEFDISYDDDLIEFVEGGSKISGGGGILHVASTGNQTATNKKTFSIQFLAKKVGDTLVQSTGKSQIVDSQGNNFSASGNSLSLEILAASKEATLSKATGEPAKPDQNKKMPSSEKKSNSNKLLSLSTTALSLTPDFSSDITEYEASVDCETQILFFSAIPKSKKANVKIEGNESLQTGENIVKVNVTSESGRVRTYQFIVTKESLLETQKREDSKKNAGEDFSFTIEKNNGKTIIKNSYEFEVLDPSNLTKVPTGYVQSNIDLSGISVPAFTMKSDLDNNYLLLYLQGPSGVANVYQYDRQEKTLQRYTGTMVEKVNKTADIEDDEKSSDGAYSIIVIVVLVVLLLLMMIAMVKIMIKQRELIEENEKAKEKKLEKEDDIL